MAGFLRDLATWWFGAHTTRKLIWSDDILRDLVHNRSLSSITWLVRARTRYTPMNRRCLLLPRFIVSRIRSHTVLAFLLNQILSFTFILYTHRPNIYSFIEIWFTLISEV